MRNMSEFLLFSAVDHGRHPAFVPLVARRSLSNVTSGSRNNRGAFVLLSFLSFVDRFLHLVWKFGAAHVAAAGKKLAYFGV